MRTLTILKNLTTFLLLVLGFNLYHSQLTQSENYVYSKTYLSAPGDSIQRSSETVTYFDGLGRPKQTIQIKGGRTPNNDLVIPVIYDCFGRQAREYMPIPQNNTKDGGIYPQSSDCSTDGNHFPVSSPTSVYSSAEKIYSRKVLENSPLDRIQQQIQPGADWQSHPVNFAYQTNKAGDILKFTTNTLTRDGAFYTNTLTVNGYYTASKLYKNTVSDEDGNVSYEFKNEEGQTLLVRKVIGQEIEIEGPIEMNSLAAPAVAQYFDTYYVYNEYNQLVFVISPLAAAELRANSNQVISDPKNLPNAILDNLCYQYNYDGRNRLVEKKLPGKGWEYMVYDKQDRLVLTQDANLRTTTNNFGGKGWLFTKYDKLGRVVYTGFFSNTATRLAVQNALNSMQANPYNNEERTSTVNFTLQGMPMYYTKTAFPTGSMTLLSVNYYDSYPDGTPFPEQNKIFNVPILLESYDGLGHSTKSLPLASMMKNINDNLWTKNYTFYDTKGRSIGTTSINHLGGRTIVNNQLDFAGVVKKTRTSHNKTANETPLNIVENFVYDHQNRLQKHYHEVIGKSPKELLADNTYDELGRLERKKVGARSDANFTEILTPLQDIKYDYNIRGWMTGINLNQTDPGKPLDPTKLFSYKIKYNNPVNTILKKYNGNIAEIDWSYGTNSGSRYEYTYDALNRLKKGLYKGLGQTTTQENYFNEELTYDLNGNITSLKRNARPRTGTSANQVDNLTYEYENSNLSNRISTIYDNAQNASGYPAIMVPQPMTYDANGNMKTMPDKDITSPIAYNYLNLPQVIIKNNQPVTYTYRADGVKVHKSFEVNSQNIETWYLDGFVYTTPYTPDIVIALQETPAAEEMSAAGQRESFELADKAVIADPGGPVLVTETTPDFFATAEGFYDYSNFRYIYQYKDHLGNARLNFGRDEDSVLFTEDSNEYYPFGLNFINPVSRGGAAQVYNPSATYKNYKYNGKELQETGMYDYGARMYMPDIGRWGVVDPLAEVSRRWNPYTYAYNNPIMFVDPDGMLSVSSLQQMWNNTSTSSTWTNNGNGSFDGGEDPPSKKGGVRFVLNIGDGNDMYDAAKTRMKEIRQNYPNDKLIEITDGNLGNLSGIVAKHLKVAKKEGYGKTFEVSIFSHASTDGPVGSYDPTNPYDLSRESGDNIDRGQMSITGWSKINWNFDSTNSIAAFYGCQSDAFAEKFMTFTNVLYTAGVSGKSGGSESLSGNFNGTILNFLFSNSNVYLRSQTGGKVDPLIFYRRGYTQKIGDKSFLKPIEYYRNATVPSK